MGGCHQNFSLRKIMAMGIPEDMLGSCIELACYFLTAVAAAIGFMITGRM